MLPTFSGVVKRLDAQSVQDFWTLHSDAGCGNCFCVAWWVPTWVGWEKRSAEENRSFRQELFARGEYDGYLLYHADVPIGWCQVGPRDRLVKIVKTFDLSPDPKVQAITCFFLRKEWRSQGIGTWFLSQVLQELRSQGVHRVEGFPSTEPGHESGEIWTGTKGMFQKAGFLPYSKYPDGRVMLWQETTK